MSSVAFHTITIDTETNLFNDLSGGTAFEITGKGRLGNHLADVNENGIPIVRTTSRYAIPAHHFSAIHHSIVAGINDTISNNPVPDIPAQGFNNALIEVYNADYYKMNYHSDHSLDLADDTYIGLFSCYEKPEELTGRHIRKLKIKDKFSDEESEIELTHNSVVLFSLATNKKFLHKIVLDTAPDPKQTLPDNRWLGITFRTSKTYIRFENNLPYFSNGQPLVLADKEQEKLFFSLRGEENRNAGFRYPDLAYTINPADLLLPLP